MDIRTGIEDRGGAGMAHARAMQATQASEERA
jgi:hypothetical protein